MKTEDYYVNTGRWQSVNGKKIKIVVFGMVVALLVTFLPFRQTEIYAGISENAYSYYQEYGNNVCFFPFSETDGMIYYATKANLASSNIRYRTIGWKLSVKDSSGKNCRRCILNLAETICMRCIVSEKVVQNIICMR